MPAKAAKQQPRDKEITERIIAAAEFVFAEMGLEKATLRDYIPREGQCRGRQLLFRLEVRSGSFGV